jgi:hypothetical protein
MKKAILILLILIPILGTGQTLKEKFIELRTEYTELADKTISFELNINKSRFGDSFTNNITVSDFKTNQFVAGVVNDNARVLLVKIKELALAKRDTLRTEYQAAIIAFQKAIDDDTAVPITAINKMVEIKELYNSYKPLKDITIFEVTADNAGIVVTNGFSVFNELLVTVLNDNIGLLQTKFKKAVRDEFLVKKAELKTKAEELIVEIDR